MSGVAETSTAVAIIAADADWPVEIPAEVDSTLTASLPGKPDGACWTLSPESAFVGSFRSTTSPPADGSASFAKLFTAVRRSAPAEVIGKGAKPFAVR